MATAELLLDQAPPEVASLSVVVAPTHTVVEPEMAATVWALKPAGKTRPANAIRRIFRKFIVRIIINRCVVG